MGKLGMWSVSKVEFVCPSIWDQPELDHSEDKASHDATHVEEPDPPITASDRYDGHFPIRMPSMINHSSSRTSLLDDGRTLDIYIDQSTQFDQVPRQRWPFRPRGNIDGNERLR